MDFKNILALAADGQEFDREQAETAFDIIMSGDATPAQIGAFLMSLRMRGETVTEIAAAATVMRATKYLISLANSAYCLSPSARLPSAARRIASVGMRVLSRYMPKTFAATMTHYMAHRRQVSSPNCVIYKGGL